MKTFLYLLIGFFFGIAFSVVLILKVFPSMMIVSKESRFSYEETVKMIDENSEKNGWAVLKVWDLTKRMEAAGYEDSPSVKVLELCHAENTYEVLKNEEDMFISAIMPCRMAVYELNNGKTMISRMNIGLMSKMFSNNVRKIMGGVAEDDKRILKDIITETE